MDTRFFSQRPARNTGLVEGGSKPLDCFTNHETHKSIFQYALQEQKHTSMCYGRFIRPRMEKTADERREVLRRFIQSHGLKIARWCKESGVDKNSVYNFLNGHSQSLDMRTYAKLARTAEAQVWQLSGDQPEPPSPTSIWVTGYLQAGSFREAVEWVDSDWYPVDVPVPTRFRGRAKALEVRGASMNIDYPEGSIAVYVDMLDFRAPKNGDDVVVHCTRADGMVEATLKEYRLDDDGKHWLWPRSHDPLHQAPLNIDEPDDVGCEITIKGIVIGSYRPRHF